jgi:hypothetical protein
MTSVVALAGPPTGTRERLRWAHPDLGPEALGLDSLEPLFAPAPDLLARLEVLERSTERQRVRFPLPGSPDARGNLSGKPGPLGTGFLWLTVHHGGLGDLLRARFTAPRSASLAEREWNLLCHLRAHGVGTPEPLLVGARGAGLFSAHSFLLVRAPADVFLLTRWLRTDGIGAERERGVESLGRTLANLRRSGVELPYLGAEHLWLTPSGSGECETHDLGGLRKNKLPSVTIVDVQEGRIHPRPRADAPAGLLLELGRLLEPRECARVETLARDALKGGA